MGLNAVDIADKLEGEVGTGDERAYFDLNVDAEIGDMIFSFLYYGGSMGDPIYNALPSAYPVHLRFLWPRCEFPYALLQRWIHPFKANSHT